MKITIELYGKKYIVEDEDSDEVCLPEILAIFSGLLRSAGYSFAGELEIVEPTLPDA